MRTHVEFQAGFLVAGTIEKGTMVFAMRNNLTLVSRIKQGWICPLYYMFFEGTQEDIKNFDMEWSNWIMDLAKQQRSIENDPNNR